MPRVFVYEYLTADGIGRDPESPDHRMHCEGRAMRDAVAEDFARVHDFQVYTAVNYSLDPDPNRCVRRAVEGMDYCLVIAPEIDNVLGEVCQSVRPTRAVLLGSTPGAIHLTSDKLALSRHWRSLGIPTPETVLVERWPAGRLPCVIKPSCGAGSTTAYLCRTDGEFGSNRLRANSEATSDLIAQDFVPGRPASVAFLIGETQTVPLLPTFQRLSDDGRFRYLGGELPIPPRLADRAVRLGRRAVACVPGLLGYAGVDLVLGDAEDGSQDYAIEINPRLTTSYVGLRALADFNIAEAMLNLATGRPPPIIRWRPGRVRFEPDGKVTYDATPGSVGD
jgi:predicted ATP-grasp superfamily ATP-dependent carboligase